MSTEDAIQRLQVDVELINKRLAKVELRFAGYVGFIAGLLFIINKLF